VQRSPPGFDYRRSCLGVMTDIRFLSLITLAETQVVSRTGLLLSLMGRRWRNALRFSALHSLRCVFGVLCSW